MAIFTRMGSEVEIIGYNYNTGSVVIKYPDGGIATAAVCELKADRGIEEIEQTIEAIKC